MSVAYELKVKRAALVDRLQQLEKERAEIQELMGALDRVILSYEHDYQPSPMFGSARRERSRKVKPPSTPTTHRPKLPQIAGS